MKNQKYTYPNQADLKKQHAGRTRHNFIEHSPNDGHQRRMPIGINAFAGFQNLIDGVITHEARIHDAEMKQKSEKKAQFDWQLGIKNRSINIHRTQHAFLKTNRREVEKFRIMPVSEPAATAIAGC
ncbi:MAG: hypothetical protein ACXWEU_04540 [Methylomonas sp.]